MTAFHHVGCDFRGDCGPDLPFVEIASAIIASSHGGHLHDPPVEAAVLDGFGKVLGPYSLHSGQIGYGAGHFQDPDGTAGGEAELFNG